MAYQGTCQCGKLLFDVPDFKAFKAPAPVEITCQHCGREYQVYPDDKLGIGIKRPGRKRLIATERYG
jgi:hypothetical protein